MELLVILCWYISTSHRSERLLVQTSTGRRWHYPFVHTLAIEGRGQSLSQMRQNDLICLFHFLHYWSQRTLDRLSSKSLSRSSATRRLPMLAGEQSRTQVPHTSGLLILTVKRGVTVLQREHRSHTCHLLDAWTWASYWTSEPVCAAIRRG